MSWKIPHSLFFIVLLLGIEPAAFAAETPKWQTDWEKTIEAAKKEGQLVIYGSAEYEQLYAEFHKKFPEIKVTGVFGRGADVAQRLELLKEIVPRLSRVAVLASSGSADYALVSKEIEIAAGPLGVRLQSLNILSPKDFETAFQDAAKGRADAVLFRVPGPILSSHRTEVAALAVKSRLPAIYESAQEVEAGGLMSYGVNANDLYRRAATYVDKILKGRMPAELPVEQPTKFEFIINLKAAKRIGLTIPPNVLVRADRVIR